MTHISTFSSTLDLQEHLAWSDDQGEQIWTLIEKGYSYQELETLFAMINPLLANSNVLEVMDTYHNTSSPEDAHFYPSLVEFALKEFPHGDAQTQHIFTMKHLKENRVTVMDTHARVAQITATNAIPYVWQRPQY